MTTYSRDTSAGRKHETVLHLVYRITITGSLETAGLFETREKAEETLAWLDQQRTDTYHQSVWQIANVPCVSWGIVDDVVGRNGTFAPEPWGEDFPFWLF